MKELGLKAVAALKELYPDAACSLEYGNDPFRLLVMARLSAQCTDARVNLVSRELFELFPTVGDMANADITDVEKCIRPCGLYHVKAKDIVAMSQKIISDFKGEVPRDMEGLLSLDGVGRKIANLMLGDVFGEPAIVTDTHCIRICGRLGFYPETEKNPRKIEKILTEIIDKPEQADFCHRLVLFGRDICKARGAECPRCPLRCLCAHNKPKN